MPCFSSYNSPSNCTQDNCAWPFHAFSPTEWQCLVHHMLAEGLAEGCLVSVWERMGEGQTPPPGCPSPQKSLFLPLPLKYKDLLLLLFFKKIFIYLFGCTGSYLRHTGSLVVACKLLGAACMWDPVPRPGIKPGPPALGAQSLIHCATREVPRISFFSFSSLTLSLTSPKPLSRLLRRCPSSLRLPPGPCSLQDPTQLSQLSADLCTEMIPRSLTLTRLK